MEHNHDPKENDKMSNFQIILLMNVPLVLVYSFCIFLHF